MPLEPEEKQALLKEFQNLSSVAAKLEFWTDKLKNNYYFYALSFSNYAVGTGNPDVRFSDLHEFKIEPADQQDIQEINQYLIDFFRLTRHVGTLKFGESNFDYATLTANLDARLEDVKNRVVFLELESTQLNAFIAERSKPDGNWLFQLNEYFVSGYKNYLLDQKEVDLSNAVAYDFQNLVAELDGVVIAKYQGYINMLIAEAKDNKPRKVVPLNLEQQFLALDYLGILDTLNKVKDDNNTLKGQFVSLLIGKDASNCRKQFSYIRELKHGKTTEEKRKISKNLSRVRDLFEEMALKSLAKKVDADLKNLSQ
ncbi:MAG: hypothetical protein IM598_00070 [Chitinophagaceae bacterium]|nr:hypothetical protein [Chitinophagaceae bacterium]MCA6460103.1 hypothetical protein [Chitinophagaceae bacterium]MCA6463198.1 hypothetical protein [Chitinophagaceae bacterium]